MEPKAEGAACANCPLRNRPMVPTYVPKESFDGTLFVGEAPGHVEVRRQIPFVGPSGRFLDREYAKVGGKPEQAARTNVVLCHPEDNATPSETSIRCCSGRLQREIAELDPKRIILLGKQAAKGLGTINGTQYDEGVWNGNAMAVVHPAFVLRDPRAGYQRFARAIERACRPPNASATVIEDSLKTEPEVIVLHTFDELKQCLDQFDGDWISFDIESNQTMWFDRMFPEIQHKKNVKGADLGEQWRGDPVLCLTFTNRVDLGYIIPDYLLYDCPAAIPVINEWFKRNKTIAHNGKFDLLFLRAIGVIDAHVDVDTILLHYALDENKGTHGLKELGQLEYGMANYEDELVTPYLRNQNDWYSKIPEDKLYLYAVWDVCLTLALAQRFKQRAVRQNLWKQPFNRVYMPAHRMLTNVEQRGVRVDIPYLQLWRTRLADRSERIRKELAHYAKNESFNPLSPPQMKQLLFHTLGLPVTQITRTNGGRSFTKEGSTGREGLAQLKGMHPAVELVGEYRTCRKMLRSYVENLLYYCDTDGRVHTSYIPFGTVTGRLSSRNPALQQIPRGGSFYGKIIKAAFIPSKGCALIDADYAQAELRVFAAVTGDPFLLNVYANDLDLHHEVMIALFGPAEAMDAYQLKQNRYYAKVYNFGWAYGASVELLVQLFGNREVAEAINARYEANMAVAAAWRTNQVALSKRQGYVESRTGRRRRNIYGDLGGPEAINSPIQSGASDCTLLSAERLDREGHQVLLLVHDNIVAEAPERDAIELQGYVGRVMREEAAAIYPEVKWAADVDEPKDRWMKMPKDIEIKEWLEAGDRIGSDLDGLEDAGLISDTLLEEQHANATSLSAGQPEAALSS